MDLGAHPLAINRPSGETAMATTDEIWSVNRRTVLPELISLSV